MGIVISSQAELMAVVERARPRHGIVLTNGCFDVLHRGHFETIRMAAKQGDCLIVAVNTDESIRALKGPHRPIYPLADRMFNVSQIAGVSYVVPFGTVEDPSVESLVERIRPDVLVKGGDYSLDGVVGAAVVERHGGRVVIAPKVTGASTTETLKRVQEIHHRDTERECVEAQYKNGRFIAVEDSRPEPRGSASATILLDLDGVLVDFVGAMARALNLPYKPEEFKGDYDVGKHFGLRTDLFSLFGPDFWEACDWMSDGREILEVVTQAGGAENVWICSSPTHESSSPMGKLRWIEKHLDDRWARRYVFTPHKGLLARPGTILIDDSDEVVRNFEAAGGRAILVPRPWNSKWGWNVSWLSDGIKVNLHSTRYVQGRLKAIMATKDTEVG
jgi:rfaE bifunctional protein nucleotidyltransferase chain/domain